MSNHRLHKQRRAHSIEMMIQRELARAERILDENNEASRVISRQLDNEPKELAKAFAEIEQKGAGK